MPIGSLIQEGSSHQGGRRSACYGSTRTTWSSSARGAVSQRVSINPSDETIHMIQKARCTCTTARRKRRQSRAAPEGAIISTPTHASLTPRPEDVCDDLERKRRAGETDRFQCLSDLHTPVARRELRVEDYAMDPSRSGTSTFLQQESATVNCGRSCPRGLALTCERDRFRNY